MDEAEGVTAVITGVLDNTLNGVFRARRVGFAAPPGSPGITVGPGFDQARPPGIAVEPVSGPDDLDGWIEVARAVWAEEAPPGDLARRRALYAGLGLDPGAALRHWLACAGDRAVGMCSAFYVEPDQVVLIDHLAVAEAARRRGIAAALLHAALGEAQRRGCRWAVLEPTPESATFYDALGFEVEPCRPGVEFYLPLEPPGQEGR